MASFYWPPQASAGASGVTTLNSLTGNLVITPGTGISVTPSGSDIIIAATGAGSGTVTSVALADGSTTPIYTISGSPITTAGTLTFTLNVQLANTFLAGPISGGSAEPAFRAIVSADIPTLNQNTTGTAANITGTVAIAHGGTGQVTAAAAYNALSPMTTTGDIEYEVSNGIATRLPIGSTGQVLTVSAGEPSWATPTTGTVTSVSIVSVNGLAGTVATATSTPAITLSTTVTGILQGNGTAISAATTTGTGDIVLSSSPTLTGTIAAASETLSGTLIATGAISGSNLTSAGHASADLAIANNLSDVASASTSFNNISPMTTLGDIIYGGTVGAGTRLSGNTTSAQQFLAQTGTGSISAAPIWTTLPAALFTGMTTQIFFSGSGTYTPTSGSVKSIRLKMVGGGGGTSGVGSSSTSGTNGGNSSFGSFTALGGAAAGGGGSGGSGTVNVIRIPGQNGSNGAQNSTFSIGGQGGASHLGSVTSSVFNTTASSSSAGTNGQNYGSGGGGATGDLATFGQAQGSGGGEYVETIITPATSVSYSVALGGTAGTGSSNPGSTGAPGIIIVEETYQ